MFATSVIFLGLATAVAGAARARAEPLSYEAALQQALARSAEAQRAALAIELASVDQALGELADDPRVTLSGSLAARWGPPSATSAAGGSRGGTRAASGLGAARPLEDWRYSKEQTYGIELGATLYDWGRHDLRAAAAAATVASRMLAVDEVREALRFKVGRAYAVALSAERIAAITRDQVGVAEAKLGAQRQNYRRGLRPESDVVTAEVEVGRARLAQDKADAEARTARVVLGRLIGMERDSDGLILPPASAIDARTISRAVDKLGPGATPSALKRRAREREALSVDREAIEVSKKPIVTGSVGVAESGPIAWRPALTPQLSTQLGISWDIPWNGMRREEERRVALRAQDLTLQNAAELGARADREAVALTSLAAAARQWGALAKQLELLEKQRRLVQSRYGQGKASAIELGQAEADLVSLRLDQARLAAVELLAAIDVAEARAVPDVGLLFR